MDGSINGSVNTKERNLKIFCAYDQDTNRIHQESEHDYRSKFERDRDRILYSKAFRRLSGKTQVFLVGKDDHLRTRLTHTLEVVQISTTIANHLGLNTSLTEAIAYGHDIGHTPFGHVGERTLNHIMNSCYSIKNFNNLKEQNRGFKHNFQGLKVVMEMEKSTKLYQGLNLTKYTLWGISNHSSKEYKKCQRYKENKDSNECTLLLNNKCVSCNGLFGLESYSELIDIINDDNFTFEAVVVSIADEIAQRHHDIEDGLEANILNKDLVLSKFEEYFKSYLSQEDNKLISLLKDEDEKVYFMPALSKLIVNFYVNKLMKDMKTRFDSLIKEHSIGNYQDFIKNKSKITKNMKKLSDLGFDQDFCSCDDEFQKFLRSRILNSHKAQCMDGKADYIIRQLFKAYITNPQQLPDKTIETVYEKYSRYNKSFTVGSLNGVGDLRNRLDEDHFIKTDSNFKDIILRVICDYISGMTDKYALEQYRSLYESQVVMY